MFKSLSCLRKIKIFPYVLRDLTVLLIKHFPSQKRLIMCHKGIKKTSITEIVEERIYITYKI